MNQLPIHVQPNEKNAILLDYPWTLISQCTFHDTATVVYFDHRHYAALTIEKSNSLAHSASAFCNSHKCFLSRINHNASDYYADGNRCEFEANMRKGTVNREALFYESFFFRPINKNDTVIWNFPTLQIASSLTFLNVIRRTLCECYAPSAASNSPSGTLWPRSLFFVRGGGRNLPMQHFSRIIRRYSSQTQITHSKLHESPQQAQIPMKSCCDTTLAWWCVNRIIRGKVLFTPIHSSLAQSMETPGDRAMCLWMHLKPPS